MAIIKYTKLINIKKFIDIVLNKNEKVFIIHIIILKIIKIIIYLI